MAITGKTREDKNFESKSLKIGIGEVRVVAINPSNEEYSEVLGIDLKEESKATEYLSQSKDNNTVLRLDIWVENIKSKEKDKITFFLEDKLVENKDNTKKQYINTQGMSSWSDDPNNLQEWFSKYEYRQAHVGEADLHNFLRTWLNKLDTREGDLLLDWKPLMKNNLKEMTSQLGGEYEGTFLVPYVVKSVEKDGETKNYQSIYNREFLPSYCMKFLRNTNYDNEIELAKVKAKNPKTLKGVEKTMYKFITQVTGDHGIKDSFSLREVREFNPDEHLPSTSKVIQEDDASY